MTSSALTPTQIRERSKRIGASDIPIIIGVSKYKTATQLWREKTGQVEPDFSTSSFSDWGHRLEDDIAQAWTEKVLKGGSWMERARPPFHQDKNLKHFTASPDREYEVEGDGVAILECKARVSSNGWGPDGGSEIPPDVEAQVRWQMLVCDVPRAHVAVLIAGHDLRTYVIERDLQVEGILIARATLFWNAVTEGKEPPEWQRNLVEEELDTVEQSELDRVANLAVAYRQTVDQLDELEEDKAVLRRELEEIVEKYDGRYEFPGGSVKLTQVKGKLTVDWEALANEAYGNEGIPKSVLRQHQTLGKGYHRLDVKVTPAEE